MIDFSKLKRDPNLANTHWVKTKDFKIITKVDCQIVFPSRYFQANLGSLGSPIEALAVFAIVVGSTYAVSKAIAIMPLTPNEFKKQVIDEDEYTVLSFTAGSVICPDYRLMMQDTLLYYVDEEFYRKGKIPVFFDPDLDTPHLMKTLSYYTGIHATINSRPWELIASFISRNPSNLREFYRHQKTNKGACAYVPLNSVAFSAVSTTSKLTGAYLDEGLLSAALHQSTEISLNEEIMRS